MDFIIIGGQKCASSYIHRTIGEHPEISTLPYECPHLESPDYENGGLEQLSQLLGDLDQEKVIGFKRPNYLANFDVPDRIAQINPKMKLIAVVRNPLDRLKSAYFHNMKYGTGPVLPLNQGVELLLEHGVIKDYARTRELLEFGFYHKYLSKYQDIFGDNLMVINFSDIKKDKIAVIRACYRFLGISEDFIPEKALNSRPQQVVYSLTRAKVLALRNPFKYTYNKNRTRLFTKKQSFVDRIICKTINVFDNVVMSRIFSGNQKPDYSPEIKNRLQELFLPDITALEKSFNLDLSDWK